jgi:transposase-like protein
MPRSVTTDGNQQAMRTIRMLWPGVILQRCVVHIQRQGIMWCRRPPKRTDAKRLRELFLRISHIYSTEERDRFIEDFMAWEQHYGRRIQEQPERGRVFSDIKRARSMVSKALPDMFHYLDDPKIPSSTNGLEGYFSRLKGHYRHHRGLHRDKRHNYFKWYFYLRPR